MEATLFSGWIYDYLQPHAQELKVANPGRLKAICAGKKKNDHLDAATLADLLRANLVPECYMAPTEMRELRRVLRYRNLIVQEATRMKNRAAGLLMEVGAEYNKQRLHGKRYWHQLLDSLDNMPDSVIHLLQISRSQIELFAGLQQGLLKALRNNRALNERVQRLMSIPGVGQITALTWALEVGDPHRFSRIRQAISYSGLCSAQVSSAGKDKRGPLSKQRNKHLQSVLIEAAKLAPRYNPQLAAVENGLASARELTRGNRNRATLAVARKLTSYLLAVDKNNKDFEPRPVAAK